MMYFFVFEYIIKMKAQISTLLILEQELLSLADIC